MKRMVLMLVFALCSKLLAAQSWPQIFPDPLLQTYINEALENNSDLRTAQLSLEQSEAMLRQARLSYLPNAANAYYTLVMLDQQYAVTLEGIRVQEENLRVLRAMKEVGQQTAAAVNQAEANYQSLMATLPMLEAQIRNATELYQSI